MHREGKFRKLGWIRKWGRLRLSALAGEYQLPLWVPVLAQTYFLFLKRHLIHFHDLKVYQPDQTGSVFSSCFLGALANIFPGLSIWDF